MKCCVGGCNEEDVPTYPLTLYGEIDMIAEIPLCKIHAIQANIAPVGG